VLERWKVNLSLYPTELDCEYDWSFDDPALVLGHFLVHLGTEGMEVLVDVTTDPERYQLGCYKVRPCVPQSVGEYDTRGWQDDDDDVRM
jgi:hypothetical protein